MRAMLFLSRFRLYVPVLALALVAAPMRAQPASATFRAALVESYSVGYSWSGASDLERGGISVGEITVHHVEGSFAGRAPVGAGILLTYGAAFNINQLEAGAGAALPDRLGELTLNLGLTHKFSTRWSGSVFVRPGFYNDLEDFSSDSFNAPFLAIANFVQSADLVWLFGASVNPFSERPFAPVAGVRWKFAKGWMFNIGFPRIGVTWDASKTLSLNAGLGIQGGSYRVTENLVSSAPGNAQVDKTYVDYREIRIGAGANWKLSEKISLVAEAGMMTDRKFDYYDREFSLNGSAAPYLTLGFTGRF
jgi:hypothetical protein